MTTQGVKTVQCTVCDGDIPIIDRNPAFCPYCMNAQDLPQDIQNDVTAHNSALDQIKLEIENTRQTTKSIYSHRIVSVISIGLSLLLYTSFIAAIAYSNSSFKDIGTVVYAILIFAALVLVPPCVVFAIIIKYRKNRKIQLALLPMAKLRLEGKLTVQCPNCGGDLDGNNSIQTTCSWCGAKCLLPIILVKKAQHSLLREIFKAKASLAYATNSQTSTYKIVGWGIVVFGVLLWLGFGVGTGLMGSCQGNELIVGKSELFMNILKSLGMSIFMAGLFVSLGIYMIRVYGKN